MAVTTNLSLRKPTLADTFSLANDLNANWDILDALFGVLNVDIANTRLGIGGTPDDWLHIIGNNACIKLEDDSGNYARIKVGNSQLTLEADPDNAVTSTDMVFKMDGAEVARFQQGGKFGIGLTPTTNMAGLSIEAGLLTLKERATPTADTDYGKVYCKNTNELFFQDGAGVEHKIAFV